jgi:hypothetical protein
MKARYQGYYIEKSLEAIRDRNVGTDPNLWDAPVLLQIMISYWDPVFKASFDEKWGQPTKNLANEVKEIRNKAKHDQDQYFDDEYTNWALDRIGSLLRSVSRNNPTEDDRLRQDELLSLRVGEQTRTVSHQGPAEPVERSRGSRNASTIDSASNLLQSGETAIVLFTKGMRLVDRKSDGSGSSGNWVTNPGHHEIPDKVIIYDRIPGRIPLKSHVHMGDYVGAASSPERGRVVIRFQNLQEVGTTNQNWYQFADTGPGPVRYLKKR